MNQPVNSADIHKAIVQEQAAQDRKKMMLNGVLLLLLLAAPFMIYPVFLMKILCFALFAVAFNLLFGFTGLLSLGQAAFYGTGGFLTAYLLVDGIIEQTLLALLAPRRRARTCTCPRCGSRRACRRRRRQHRARRRWRRACIFLCGPFADVLFISTSIPWVTHPLAHCNGWCATGTGWCDRVVRLQRSKKRDTLGFTRRGLESVGESHIYARGKDGEEGARAE